jgi:hypothetical protein
VFSDANQDCGFGFIQGLFSCLRSWGLGVRVKAPQVYPALFARTWDCYGKEPSIVPEVDQFFLLEWFLSLAILAL